MAKVKGFFARVTDRTKLDAPEFHSGGGGGIKGSNHKIWANSLSIPFILSKSRGKNPFVPS